VFSQIPGKISKNVGEYMPDAGGQAYQLLHSGAYALGPGKGLVSLPPTSRWPRSPRSHSSKEGRVMSRALAAPGVRSGGHAPPAAYRRAWAALAAEWIKLRSLLTCS